MLKKISKGFSPAKQADAEEKHKAYTMWREWMKTEHLMHWELRHPKTSDMHEGVPSIAAEEYAAAVLLLDPSGSGKASADALPT